MQSKRQSLIEIFSGLTIGIIGSLILTLLINHSVDDRNIASVLTVGACTIWSFARGYCLRRWFNARIGRSKYEVALERVYDRLDAFVTDERDMPLESVEVTRDIAGRALEDDE